MVVTGSSGDPQIATVFFSTMRGLRMARARLFLRDSVTGAGGVVRFS